MVARGRFKGEKKRKRERERETKKKKKKLEKEIGRNGSHRSQRTFKKIIVSSMRTEYRTLDLTISRIFIINGNISRIIE